MNVIGLDLSLTSTGAASIYGARLVGVANFKSAGKRNATKSETAARIAGMAEAVLSYITDDVDAVAIEAPSFASKFGLQHERAGLWWTIVQALDARGIPMIFIAPKQRAKYATGNGNADKTEVKAAVIGRYENPQCKIRNDDIADAVVLAAMGSRLLGHPMPVEADLTTAHLATITHIDVPIIGA